MYDLVLIVLFVLIIICAWLIASPLIAQFFQQPPARAGGERSKLEAMIIALFEDITGRPFASTRPSWLRDPETGATLELDGYNKDLRVAVEVQGPGHIKPIPGESYDKYIARVARDEYKRARCAEHKTALITIDYRIKSREALRSYIASRLFDVGALAERPRDYIYPLDMTPWKIGT